MGDFSLLVSEMSDKNVRRAELEIFCYKELALLIKKKKKIQTYLEMDLVVNIFCHP